MEESNKVMYMRVSVSGGTNVICCPLRQSLSWAWLLASESLNTLQGLWETQRRWTSLKLLHVHSSSGLFPLNISACQGEAAWQRKEREQSEKS